MARHDWGTAREFERHRDCADVELPRRTIEYFNMAFEKMHGTRIVSIFGTRRQGLLRGSHVVIVGGTCRGPTRLHSIQVR